MDTIRVKDFEVLMPIDRVRTPQARMIELKRQPECLEACTLEKLPIPSLQGLHQIWASLEKETIYLNNMERVPTMPAQAASLTGNVLYKTVATSEFGHLDFCCTDWAVGARYSFSEVCSPFMADSLIKISLAIKINPLKVRIKLE